MKLVDTDICIDLLRKQPDAISWFATLTETPGIPGFVALELILGCRDATELRRVQKFIQRFDIVWPTEHGLNRAVSDYGPLRLAHGIGGMDALIAATVVEHNGTLQTLNVRHFRAIAGLDIESPYSK